MLIVIPIKNKLLSAVKKKMMKQKVLKCSLVEDNDLIDEVIYQCWQIRRYNHYFWNQDAELAGAWICQRLKSSGSSYGE